MSSHNDPTYAAETSGTSTATTRRARSRARGSSTTANMESTPQSRRVSHETTGSRERRASRDPERGYVHWAHPNTGGTGPNSRPESAHEYPATMAGLAGGPGAVFGNWAGGLKRHALMPTKGKDWARSKKDMKWDAQFLGPEKKIRRVLMIEYIKTEVTEGDNRYTKMEARASEFRDIGSIQGICSLDRKEGVILRVFHVQNFPEAVEFFVLKYRMHDKRNIDGWDDLKEWVYHFRPARRAGKPVPMAKTFKKRQMPGLAKVAWGMDCLKVMRVGYRPDNKKERHPDTKVAELKGFLEDGEDAVSDARGLFHPEDPWASEDEDDDRSPSPFWSETDPLNPKLVHHTHDVYSQRLSVYLQWVTNESRNHHDPILSPERKRAATDIFDNGSTIIVFDNSESLSICDTIVPAHGEIERIWRGPGTSYYEINADPNGQEDPTADNRFALDFIQRIVETIYNSVADCWEAVLDVAWDHESILQDSIYEHPADESRAPELFKNSETWLKFSKLMSYHLECIGDVQEYIGDFKDEDETNDSDMATFSWLKSVEQTFQRLNGYIEDDLIKQTDKLTDLMYKTVGIRDSQDSLRLGTSMWRLSWVTFIFLPLTFITGFFGMNVDVFGDNPSIKWYFIAAAPFMSLVVISVFMLKWFIDRHRRPVYERGVYERLFNELQQSNADLWSSQGPRDVRPVGWRSKIKWYIIYRFTKGKAEYRGTSTEYDSLWSRFQQHVVRRWSPDIIFKPRESDWIIDGETGFVTRGRRRASSRSNSRSRSRSGVVSRGMQPGFATGKRGPGVGPQSLPSQRKGPGVERRNPVEKSEPFEYNSMRPTPGAATPRISVEQASPTVQRIESELYEKLANKTSDGQVLPRAVVESPSQMTLSSGSSIRQNENLKGPTPKQKE